MVEAQTEVSREVEKRAPLRKAKVPEDLKTLTLLEQLRRHHGGIAVVGPGPTNVDPIVARSVVLPVLPGLVVPATRLLRLRLHRLRLLRLLRPKLSLKLRLRLRL